MKRTDSHSFFVDAPQAVVWSTLWDTTRIAACIPGCESVVERSPMAVYDVAIRRKVGPLLIRMAVEAEVVERTEPSLIKVRGSGKDPRLRSVAVFGLVIRLRPGSAGTEIDVETEFELSGLIVSLGERLIAAQLDREMEDFVACLHDTVDSSALAAGRDTSPLPAPMKETGA